MASKTITISIKADALSLLQAAGLNLCYTKQMQVSNNYFANVVWQQTLNTDLSEGDNTITWTPEYQVALTQSWEAGQIIKSYSATPRQLGLGEAISYTDGKWGAVAPGASNALQVIQNDTNKLPHVVALAPDANGKFAPFYASQPVVLGGSTWTGFPVERYIAFLSGDASTSQMIAGISGPQSNVIDITVPSTATLDIHVENKTVKFGPINYS